MLLFSFRVIVPLILDQNYINLKNQVIKAERRVLKELGFSVHVKHPHKVNINLSFFILQKCINYALATIVKHLKIYFEFEHGCLCHKNEFTMLLN